VTNDQRRREGEKPETVACSTELTCLSVATSSDWRLTNPRFQGEAFAANLAIADKVMEIAKAKSVTATQVIIVFSLPTDVSIIDLTEQRQNKVALAWVLAKGSDIVVIPGTTKAKNFEGGQFYIHRSVSHYLFLETNRLSWCNECEIDKR
jgi:aryl-alcohol dehydrogenase-like predicted oxidoreductase